MGVLGRTRPPLNLVISNVPGPREPLFCAGAKLEANYPVSAIADGVGLNMTVMSYRDRLDFGLVGDRDQIDDLMAADARAPEGARRHGAAGLRRAHGGERAGGGERALRRARH